jgi:hypothetical protein
MDLLIFFLPGAAVLVGYILLARPTWFPRLIEKIYSD